MIRINFYHMGDAYLFYVVVSETELLVESDPFIRTENDAEFERDRLQYQWNIWGSMKERRDRRT